MADWKAVSGSKDYKALSDEDKDAVRADFFDRSIAPTLNAEDVHAIRSDFMERTKPTLIGKIKDVVVDALTPDSTTAPAPKPAAASGVSAMRGTSGSWDEKPVAPVPVSSDNQRLIDSVTPPAQAAADASAAVPVPALDAQHGFAERSQELRGAQDTAAADAWRTRRAEQLRKQVPEASDQTINNMIDTEIATNGPVNPSTVSQSNFDFDTHKEYADAGTLKRGAKLGVNQLEQSASGLNQFLGDALGLKGYSNAQADIGAKLNREASAIGNRSEYLTRNWEGAVSSIISQTPGLAVSVLSGGSVPLVMMGLQQFGSDYQGGRAAGLSQEDATARAGINGVAEIIGEKIGMPSFLKVFKDVTKGVPTEQLLKHLAAHVAAEVPGEELTTLIEFANDKYPGWGQNKQADLQNYIGQAADTLVQTVMQAGAMGATGVAKNAVAAKRLQSAEVAADVAKANATAQWEGAFAPSQRPAGTLERAAIVAAQSGLTQQAAADLTPHPAAIDAAELLDTKGGADVGQGQTAERAATGDQAGGNEPGGSGSAEPVGQPAGGGEPAGAPDTGSGTPVAAGITVQPGDSLAGDTRTPTVDVMRKAVDLVGADEFKRRTDDHISAIEGEEGEPLPPAERAAEIEGVARKIVDGAYGDAAKPGEIDTAAHEAATSPKNDTPQPTEAQKEAGNYKKGHVTLHGMDISIENPSGSKRSGTDTNGKPWEVEMRDHYGYIKGTVGKDKDHIDTFIVGSNPEKSNTVYVVDQKDPATGKFDEHKVIMGMGPGESDFAKARYLNNYARGWQGMGAITEMTVPEFKDWLKNGDTTKPVAKASATEGTIARVGTTPKNTEDVTVKNGVVHLGKYPAQNFETGEDITVTEPTFEAVSKALKDGGALSNKQRIYGGTAAPTEAKGGNPFKRAFETLVAGSMPQGVKDPEQAKAAFDAGKIKNAGDLRRFEENGYPQPKQPKAKTPKAAEPAKTADEFAERARKQFVKTIKDMGGIAVTESKDVTGEPAHIANRMAPGLFRTGGNALDLVARRLHEAGYLSDAHYNDVDGGVQATRDLVNQALGKEPVMTASDQERYNELAQQEQRLSEQERALADEMPAHDETLAEILAEEADDLPDLDAGTTDPAESMRAMGFTEDEINEAIRPQEKGTETAGGTAAGSPRQGNQAGQGQEAADSGTGQDAGFALEHQTEAQLAAAAKTAKQQAEDKAKEDAKAEAKRRADAERGDFTLTGSDRASDANSKQGDIFSQPAKAPARFEIGATLTKEQRKTVLASLVDVYKQKGAEKETRINASGDEYLAYPHQPELFEKSDITGAMVRYHVTLPDGRIAHPTELFPDYTQSDIDAALQKQRNDDGRDKRIAVELERNAKKAEFTTPEADRSYWQKLSDDSKKQTAHGGWSIAPPSERVMFTKDGVFYSLYKDANDQILALQSRGWKPVQEKPVSTEREQAAKPNESSDQPKQGEIGMKLGSGEVVLTASGRETTPFPKVKTGPRNTSITLKAADKWLMQNALDEANSRGDSYNARMFEAALDKPQQADKDGAEEYLFGNQPDVVPSILKPLTSSTAPEHAAVGVDDRELGEIVSEFNEAQARTVEDGQDVTHVFDAPSKGEIVRLGDKAKVYHKEHGWMTVDEAKARIAEWKQNAASQGDKANENGNAQRVVLSLFDLTGKWSKPWEDAGYQVYRFDIQDMEMNEVGGDEVNVGDVHNFSHEFFADLFGSFDGNDIHAILAACPCTDFASSGARHFAAKDEDGRTVASVKLVHQALATIEYFKPAVWAIENPVGRIEKLGGLPPWRLSFDPNHLGDPYTKKTLLWGRFNADLPIAPVEPTEGSKMHSQYGGKSLATKNARSATPEGFAYGFFMANNAVDHPVMAIANKYDRIDRSVIQKAVDAGVTEQQISDAVDDFYYQDLNDEAANDAIRELADNATPPNGGIKFDEQLDGFAERLNVARLAYGEDNANSLFNRIIKDNFLTKDEANTLVKRADEMLNSHKPANKPDAASTKINESGVYTPAAHEDLFKRVNAGEATADEFKAAFEALLKNRDSITADLLGMTKAALFKRFPGIEYRYKNDKKADVVRAAVRDMEGDFVLGQSYSFSMGKDAQIQAIRAIVDRVTDQTLADHAKEISDARDERAAIRKEAMAGMENPQTLDDFHRLMHSKAQEFGAGATFQQVRMTLTPAQREQFDTLAAEKSRSERASSREAQQDRGIRAPGQSVDTTEIIKTRHTKHGHDLWQFNLVERVSGEEFKSLVAQAKRMGGDYSSYRGNGAIPGWQFRTEEAAKAFKALVAGDTEQAKDVMHTRRDAYADDRSQTAVERLNEMASSLEEKADASLNRDRKANTAKRARQAASAENAANSDKAMAKTMRNIAAAIESGKAKLLDRVRQKVQVETLYGFVNTAQSEKQRALYPSYAEQEKHAGEKPNAETADYVAFPTYTAFRSDLASLGRALLETEGTKKIGQQIMKVADDVSAAYLKFAKENIVKVAAFSTKGGGHASFPSKAAAEASILRSGYKGAAIVLPVSRGVNTVILSPSEAIKRGIWEGDNDKRITLNPALGSEIVEKLGKINRNRSVVSAPWQFDSAHDKRKRLAGMGIETPAELRAAVREFIALREAPKETDKIKEMERAMIGRKNDGLDFFPTPASVADEMVETAGIQPGMSVLEPSAGMGHIAERIREAGVDPDVVELSGDRRELLEAKGFKVVGHDFMDIKPREFFTFGDTFRDKDGTEGVMRGLGGMGSNRVRLVVNGDERTARYVDRDELTPVSKNGTDSGYDRILMNPPFGDRRDAEHVQHAYELLKPGGRLVSIMGEGVFFGSDKKAQAFRDWLEKVGATDEKLDEGTFLDPSLPVNTGVNARMVVIDKPGTSPAPVAEPTETDGNVANQPAADYGNVQTDTPEFKKWFGNSRVVDSSGKPLVVYHGSPDARFMAEDSTFKTLGERYGSGDQPDKRAFWFAASRQSAATYTDEHRAFDYQKAESGIIPAYLSLQNPLVVDGAGKHWRDAQARGKTSDVINEARAAGNDGVIIRNVKDDYSSDKGTKATDTYVVFSSNQIKHAEKNSGAFDPQNPSIVAEPNDAAYTDPYEAGSFETRPNTRPQQLAAGRAALADAERRILGVNHSGVPGGISLLGSRISAEFRANGGASLVGQTVAAPEDLAFAAQILRDPRFETFRFFYTDDAGKIVSERAYSSRLAGSVYLPENHAEQVREDMKQAGASGYWMLHNHPSGSASESDADRKLTANVARMVKGFKGHVVIDHNEYNHISLDGMHAVGNVVKAPQLAAIDLTANPEKAHPLLGEVVSGPSVLAGIAKRLQQKDGYVVVMGTDGQGKITFLTEVPTAYLKGASGNQAKQLRAIAAAKRASRETGSMNLFAAVPGDLMDFGVLTDSGLFRDVVPMSGSSSALSLGVMNSGGLPVTAAERNGGKAHAHQDETTYDAGGQQRIPEATHPQEPQITRQPPLDMPPGWSGNQASWDAPENTGFDNLVYKLQNKHIDTKRVIEAIQQTGKQLADKWNPYLQEELFHGRASKRTLDFVDRELNPMLKQAQAAGLTLADIDQYLHARHAEEANNLIAERDPSMEDGGSGMKTADARAYLAGLPADKARDLAAVADKVDAMLAKTRQLYADYGLESQDTVDEWGRMFKHYVPLMREDKGGGMGIGQGFSIKGKEVKHRTGSTRAVVDILANVAMQRERAIVRGEKNRVAVSLAGLAKLHPNPDFWTFDKVPTERVLNERTGLVETRANPTFKTRPNVIVAKIKGKGGQIEERAIIFNERNERALRMVQALKNLDMNRLDGLMGTLAKVTRYFSSINTQYNPVFGFVNLTRDVQDAAINLSSTQLRNKKAAVVANTFSALSGIYRDVRAERRGGEAASKWAHLWEEFNLEGGQTGYRDLYATSADRAKAIENALNPTSWMDSGLGKVFTAGGVLKVPLSVAQKSAGWIFDWLSDFNETMENAVRLSSYKVGLEQGMSKQQAASLAKNLTVNFNRKGQAGQQVGALYAFFNASMQGTARMGETLTKMQGGNLKTLRLSGAGMKIISGGMLLGAMQAAMMAAAGFGDDDPPEFVRQANLIIPLSPVSGKKNYLMIPMPLGFRVFPNIGRILTEVALHGGKDAGKRLFDIMGIISDAFDPLGGSGMSLQTVSPTALDPAVDLATNHDWTGKPIYREDFNHNDPTPGFTRTKDTASSYAKALAEAINYATGGTEYTPGSLSPTPDQIDYLVSQVTGGVGRELGKAEQTINSMSSGEDMPAYKIPLAGRYYGSSEGQASQAGRFYENIKRANEYGNEIIGRRKDHVDTGDYLDAHPDAQEFMIMGRQAEARVRALRQRKLKMVRDGADRADVKDIEAQITEVMTDFNERAAQAQ